MRRASCSPRIRAGAGGTSRVPSGRVDRWPRLLMRLAAAGPLGAGALVIGYGLGWPPAVAAAGASVTVAGVVAAVLQPGLGTPGDS